MRINIYNDELRYDNVDIVHADVENNKYVGLRLTTIDNNCITFWVTHENIGQLKALMDECYSILDAFEWKVKC